MDCLAQYCVVFVYPWIALHNIVCCFDLSMDCLHNIVLFWPIHGLSCTILCCFGLSMDCPAQYCVVFVYPWIVLHNIVCCFDLSMDCLHNMVCCFGQSVDCPAQYFGLFSSIITCYIWGCNLIRMHYFFNIMIIFIPRHACAARVIVVVLSVCLSVCLSVEYSDSIISH